MYVYLTHVFKQLFKGIYGISYFLKCNMNGSKHFTPWNRTLESMSFMIFIEPTSFSACVQFLLLSVAVHLFY
jgi:hypothetical protein